MVATDVRAAVVENTKSLLRILGADISINDVFEVSIGLDTVTVFHHQNSIATSRTVFDMNPPHQPLATGKPVIGGYVDNDVTGGN